MRSIAASRLKCKRLMLAAGLLEMLSCGKISIVNFCLSSLQYSEFTLLGYSEFAIS
jgi:hypothetical protein